MKTVIEELSSDQALGRMCSDTIFANRYMQANNFISKSTIQALDGTQIAELIASNETCAPFEYQYK